MYCCEKIPTLFVLRRTELTKYVSIIIQYALILFFCNIVFFAFQSGFAQSLFNQRSTLDNIGYYLYLSHTHQSAAMYGNVSMVIYSKLICRVMGIASVQQLVTHNNYPIRPIFTVRTRFRVNKQNLELAFSSDSSLTACVVGIFLVHSWFAFVVTVSVFYQICMSQVSSLVLQTWLRIYCLELSRTATLMILNLLYENSSVKYSYKMCVAFEAFN